MTRTDHLPGDLEPERVSQAVEHFRQLPLSPIESLLAASQIAMLAAQRFRRECPQIRLELGSQTARQLAMTEIAEAIATLQDAASPAVHGYNELLRDPDDEPIVPQ